MQVDMYGVIRRCRNMYGERKGQKYRSLYIHAHRVQSENYYPACPNPTITLGLPPHCDRLTGTSSPYYSRARSLVLRSPTSRGGPTGYAGWAMAYPAAQQMQASHDSPAPPYISASGGRRPASVSPCSHPFSHPDTLRLVVLFMKRMILASLAVLGDGAIKSPDFLIGFLNIIASRNENISNLDMLN